jgi:chromatin remodeling complex protein RSC6
MSSKPAQKKATKAKSSQDPEAIRIKKKSSKNAPVLKSEVHEPKVVEQLIKTEPELEPELEPEPEVVEPDVEAEADQESSETKAGLKGGKDQKKKAIYEELKSDLDELLNKVLEDVADAKAAKNKGLQVSLKAYEKLLKKVKSGIKKVEPKEKKAVARSQPSGFNMPLQITDELASFSSWDPSVPKSRTDVTKLLCKYVKENNLQNPEHRKTILPDDNLCRILRYDREKEPPLTYSTMQRYIGHLFIAAE